MKKDHLRGCNDLLLRVGQGDIIAFEWLYALFQQDSIYLLLADFSTLDLAEADALYNRAMTKIWENASSYQSRSNGDTDLTAYSWIRTTILNTARDHARSARKRNQIELQETDMLAPDQETTQSEYSPIEQLGDADLALPERETNNPARLLESKLDWEAFLDTLDERERYICARRAEGATQTQIAAALNISPARLSQIITDLRHRAESIVRA